MSVWFEVEKSKSGIKSFLECNWEFHDFRPERIEFIPGKDCVEIFLKYDTMDEGVLLRFARIHGMHINIDRDYEADWLMGSVAILLENNNIIWLDYDSSGDENGEKLDEIKKSVTWVEAERIFWAITDGNGNPVEMPSDRIHQTCSIYGEIIEKHFELKAFCEDWEQIWTPHI